LSIVFVTTSHLIVLNSQQYHFNRFTYTAKNFNLNAYQLDCKYKRSCACPGKWSFPIDSTTDYPDLRRGRAINQHSDKCIIKSSLGSFALDGHLEDKPADGRDDRKSPPELPAACRHFSRDESKDRGIGCSTPDSPSQEDLVDGKELGQQGVRKELVWSTGGLSEKPREKFQN
jgi:hypothetical protein